MFVINISDLYIYAFTLVCRVFFEGFSMVAMVARAFQSRANMWQLVKKFLNYFYLTNLGAKM